MLKSCESLAYICELGSDMLACKPMQHKSGWGDYQQQQFQCKKHNHHHHYYHHHQKRMFVISVICII